MTHTDDALTEAVAKALWDFEREDWETWEILPEEWQDGQRAQATAAIAAVVREIKERGELMGGDLYLINLSDISPENPHESNEL